MGDSPPVHQQPNTKQFNMTLKNLILGAETCRKGQCREQQQVEAGPSQATVEIGASQVLGNIYKTLANMDLPMMLSVRVSETEKGREPI